MTPSAIAKQLPEDHYIEREAFARAGQILLYWVKMSHPHSADPKTGVALFYREHAIFIPNADLPVLCDLLAGIVRRGQLL